MKSNEKVQASMKKRTLLLSLIADIIKVINPKAFIDMVRLTVKE